MSAYHSLSLASPYASAILCELQADRRDQKDHEDHSWKIQNKLPAENKSQPEQPQLTYQPNTAKVLPALSLSAILCELHVDHRDQADHEDHSW